MDDLWVVVDVEAFVVSGRNHHLPILDKDIPVGIGGVAMADGEDLRGPRWLATTEVDQDCELLSKETHLGQISLNGIRTEAAMIDVQKSLLEDPVGAKTPHQPLVPADRPGRTRVVEKAPSRLRL
jgi:hypothetical protein